MSGCLASKFHFLYSSDIFLRKRKYNIFCFQNVFCFCYQYLLSDQKCLNCVVVQVMATSEADFAEISADGSFCARQLPHMSCVTLQHYGSQSPSDRLGLISGTNFGATFDCTTENLLLTYWRRARFKTVWACKSWHSWLLLT